ncbi:RNA 2',3'-cyclic phosphodiesterase [Bacteroidetes/Chlorobi group bacterium Naka2016]|jgi:2'-5' RNA ligase|nr:MAG: RNA 2',3'-cyclic phosphodiesterase [Bacteroidetes/Chlorobi group bacterium Naka2016]
MEQKKRLFIGTFLKTKELLEEYPKLRKEFEGAIWGKWVEEWNLHFTYNFLGEVDTRILEPLFKSISPHLQEYQNEIKLKGLGCFPSIRSPRVLFVNIVDQNSLLKEIHQNLANALKNFDVELDEREYHPHLTLLRIKSFKLDLFQKAMRKYQNFDFGSVSNFRVELIESKLTHEGPKYTPITNLS